MAAETSSDGLSFCFRVLVAKEGGKVTVTWRAWCHFLARGVGGSLCVKVTINHKQQETNGNAEY
jgi:hypothetical protein